MENERQDIREVLAKFQSGYVSRDTDQLDAFMQLFVEEGRFEVIGTDAYIKGVSEWSLTSESLRRMIRSDWESWGDLRLDFDGAEISIRGEVAWLAAAGTVSRTIPPEKSYQNFLGYMRWLTENELEVPAKEKILDVLRGGITTLVNSDKGESYIWPLRLTAVLVKDGGRWRFAQMTFSFPTIFPPDIRLTE